MLFVTAAANLPVRRRGAGDAALLSPLLAVLVAITLVPSLTTWLPG